MVGFPQTYPGYTPEYLLFRDCACMFGAPTNYPDVELGNQVAYFPD